MLKINNLTKIYSSGKKAVKGLTLSLNKGEIYGLIGHNGAGKTTTIKAVVGILDFEQGDILINGNSIKTNPIDCKCDIAYIPDTPHVYEFLTGIDYINFICDVFGMPVSKEKLNKYLVTFEMQSAINNRISSYSHGMRQKLLIISSLMHNPKLLVLDEPFVGLDPKSTFEFKKILKDFCKNGNSVFFSTHVLEVAERLCDKIGIIKNGKLIREGSTEKIIQGKNLGSVFMEEVYE